MNNQEFFDKTMERLSKQGVRSARGASCLYRGPNGTSCAIGFHIPDELYKSEMEGKGVVNLLIHHHPELRPLFKGVSYGLMVELQLLHDSDLGTSYFEEQVEKIAARYHLTYKEAS